MLKPVPTLATSHGRAKRKVDSSATVMVNGNAYLVDLGPHHALRFHTVKKDKTCSCGLAHCNGVKAVEGYLKGGGQRAPDKVQSGTVPDGCPICGAPVTVRARDWACTRDATHYHLFRVQRLRALSEQHQHQQPPEARAYWAELHSAFRNPEERALFLAQHALTYPAGS